MTVAEWLADMVDTRPPSWWYPGIQAVQLVDNEAARKYANLDRASLHLQSAAVCDDDPHRQHITASR